MNYIEQLEKQNEELKQLLSKAEETISNNMWEPRWIRVKESLLHPDYYLYATPLTVYAKITKKITFLMLVTGSELPWEITIEDFDNLNIDLSHKIMMRKIKKDLENINEIKDINVAKHYVEKFFEEVKENTARY